jgi:hypothetical protein
MRRLGCLGIIIILLLAVIVYDQWRIEQLRADVAAIAEKVHAGKAVKGTSAQADLVTALAEAQKYVRKAQASLAGNQAARKNLDKAASKLDSAKDVSKDIVGDAAQFLGKAKDNAVTVFQKAYKDMSEEPVKSPESKVKSEKSKAGATKPASN